MKNYFFITLLIIITAFTAKAQNWNIGLTPVDETCTGANDGKINLSITGSATGTFTWEIFESADLATPYASGTYGTDQIDGLFPDEWTVTVERNGTETRTATATVNGSANLLTVTKSVLQQNLCNSDAAGIVQATAAEGSGTYLYGLGVGAGTTTPNYTGGYADNGGLFESLPANTYSIWAKDDRGCVATTGDFVLYAPNSISLEYDTINANCNNKGGEITITSISGGTPFATGDAGDLNFQIKWFEDGNHLPDFDNESKLSGLDSGSYSVIVTDKNGCTNGDGLNFEIFSGFNFVFNSHQNVTCQDDNDGQVTVKLDTDSENDEEPFELRIYDGNSNEIVGKRQTGVAVGTATFTGLGPDTYTITATAATGCTREVEVEITEPSAPQLDDAVLTHVICKGESTGEIALSGSGGSGTILYSITGDDTTPGGDWSSATTRTGLPAGTYHIWITDDNNASCQIYENTVEITEPPTQYGLDRVDIADVSCFGKDDGTAELFYDGTTDTGHPITSIIWTNNATEEEVGNGQTTVTDLDEGSYTVTVNDTYGCVRELTFQINENDSLVINATDPVINCPLTQGAGTVDIVTEASGGTGTGTYSYEWYKGDDLIPGETSNSLTGVTDNETYTIWVTDAKGCKANRSFEVKFPDKIEISLEATTDVACKGEATGAIDISVTGGTGPYTYRWSKDGVQIPAVDGGTKQDLSGVSGGTYVVEVSDVIPCGPVTSSSIVIDEPTTTFTLSGTKTDVVCANDETGEIDADIAIDTGHPYSINITWTKDGESYDEVAGETDLTSLASGVYEMTVTDRNSCTKTMSWTIENQIDLALDPEVTQNLCNGDSNGEIKINPIGGSSSTYTIVWKNGTNTIANNVNTISSLSDGTYRVSVTDDIGCTITEEFVLDAPDDISATVAQTNISCKGEKTGALALNITGGTELYTITWEQGGNVLPSSSASLEELGPGTYDVTIEDVNDCTPFTASYTITEPATVYSISIEPSEILCVGESTGELEVAIDAEAGHPDSYTVKWFKNGGTTSIFSQTSVTAAAISAVTELNAADYSVEVTDNNGCVRTASYTLQDPEKIFFNPEITPVSCAGFEDGSISLIPTGGYGNFTYAWTFNGSAISNTQSFLNNLSAGKYKVTMTDAGGCVRDTTINMTDPLPITVSAAVAGPKCTDGADGSITLSVSNGTPPYQFEWWQGDDRISLNQDLTDLTEGTYMLIITDQFQCEIDTMKYEVSDPPSDFSIEGTVDKVSCNNLSDGVVDIDVVVTGDPDLEYSVYWEKDGELYSQDTEDLNGVDAGSYEIFVTDQYGCVKSKAFTLENPDPIELSFNIKDVSCYLDSDGSVAVQVKGGYGNYTYAWKKDGEAFNMTGSFANNLEAGFYELSVTDGEGCVLKQTVEVTQPAPFLAEITSKKSNTCSTPYDSEISAEISGGVKPYKLQWYRNGLPYSKEEDLSGIPAGTYHLMATDTNLCTTTSAEVAISTPEPLGIEVISIKENLCPNTNNGAISFQGTGGFFPYTYSFDSLAYGTKNNFVNLPDKDYLISIKDNKGCTFDTVITIGNVHHLEAEFSMEADEMAIDFPISLQDESLGDNIVGWFWDFGDTRASEEQNPAVTYTKEGTYVITLTVRNEVGCRLSKSDTVEIVRGYTFSIPTAFTPNNDRHNDTFRPSFSNVESLNIKIQDRNGILVFETDELSDSWNGDFNGIPAPQGSYYYEITFTSRSGKVRTERGKVFLLR